MQIQQYMIDKYHKDSFWYDGVIATKGDLTLIACGDIKIYQYDKDKNYKGMYDVKPRDNFDMPENDKELQKCYNNENGYYMDNNNWFEIIDKEGNNVADIYGMYDEAIQALKELEVASE